MTIQLAPFRILVIERGMALAGHLEGMEKTRNKYEGIVGRANETIALCCVDVVEHYKLS